MSQERREKGIIWIVAALVIADITAAFETTMVFTAIKVLLEEYGRPTTVGWLLTAYLLVAAASAAVCGRLGDLFGRRNVLLVMLAFAAIGSLVSAFAPTLEGVIAGRALQGLSGAILPLCIGLAREHIPQKYLATSVGIISGTAALGGGLGMIVSGLLIDNMGWRWIFAASTVLAVLSFIASVAFVPSSKGAGRGKQLDLFGGLLFVPAVTGALLAISNAQHWNWDYRFWGGLLASAAVFAIWIAHELRQPNPLIDVRLLAHRSVALPNLVMGLCALGAFQFSQLVLLLLQQPAWTGAGLAFSATVAAFFKVPGNFVTAVFSPLTGYLCGRVGSAQVIVAGMTVTGIACLAMNFLNDMPVAIFIVIVVCALGTSTVYVGVPNILVQTAPQDRTSESVGVSSVIRSLMMAIGAQGMIVLLASSTVTDPDGGAAEFPTLFAYQLTFTSIGIICLVAASVALLMVRRPSPALTTTPAN